MRTRPVFVETARSRALRERLSRPAIVAVDGATAYWLEDAAGQPISPESASSAAPLDAVVVALDAGEATDGFVLVCRLADGERYVVGDGIDLVGAALAAAGRPRAQASSGRAAAS